MATPYNLDVQHSCSECVMRAERPFCDMSPQAVAALDSLKFTSVYPKGALLFVEGEQARGVFVLCSGRAKLSTTSTDGRTVIVKIAEAGEILGASATILGKAGSAGAESVANIATSSTLVRAAVRQSSPKPSVRRPAASHAPYDP